jgi:hypothetical protein
MMLYIICQRLTGTWCGGFFIDKGVFMEKTERVDLELNRDSGIRRPANRSVQGTRRHRQGGAALVEFALVAPLFFLLVFAIIDIGRVLNVQMTLQAAVREAGRFAVTGNIVTNDRVYSIKKTAHDFSGVPFQDIQVSSGANTNCAGAPGAFVTVKVSYPVELITPLIGRFFDDGSYLCKVSATFKNEPFPSQQGVECP